MMTHEKMRSLREAKGIKSKDMAGRLGLSPSAYRRVESGETRPDLDRLKKFADELEEPLEKLLPDNMVINTHDQKGGTNGYHVTNHQNVPDEFFKQLIGEMQQMNARLLELLERKLG